MLAMLYTMEHYILNVTKYALLSTISMLSGMVSKTVIMFLPAGKIKHA
jgi:hypothetical protein